MEVVVDGRRTPGPSVEMRQVVCDPHASPEASSTASGAAIVVPSWWPADTGQIEYSLAHAHRVHYSVGSVRDDGVPIFVIGWFEIPGARSPRDWVSGDWSQPPELAQVRGWVGRVGYPPRLQTVVYCEDLEIQLLGYASHDEISQAVNSFRRVGAG